MKKQVFLLIALLGILTTGVAQTCPTQIADPSDDGSVYDVTLSVSSDCDAGKPFATGTTVTLGGQPHTVTSCGTAFGATVATIQPTGTAVVLSTSSGVAIVSGSTSFSYTNAGVPVALPVELVSFSGQNTEGGNLLTWQTAREVNNKGFQVERRQPRALGGDSWETLGFVAAKGKSATYTFTDDYRLSSVAYYRLRQIDNDGKETL
jgi:hypothetical protein